MSHRDELWYSVSKLRDALDKAEDNLNRASDAATALCKERDARRDQFDEAKVALQAVLNDRATIEEVSGARPGNQRLVVRAKGAAPSGWRDYAFDIINATMVAGENGPAERIR